MLFYPKIIYAVWLRRKYMTLADSRLSFERAKELANADVFQNIRKAASLMLADRTTLIYFLIIVAFIFIAIAGPVLAPHGYEDRMRDGDGDLIRGTGPSIQHPLGTTPLGFDVLSRLLAGARPTIITGLLGGVVVASTGLTVGMTSGYVGGRVDSVLMRITDVVYSIPLIPFALVLVAFFGIGFYETVLFIGFILWRGMARVVRAQVLQMRERPFIRSSQAIGASTPRIMIRHILPNVAPMVVLFMALGAGYSIVAMASLSFLGVTNPSLPSWGIMIRNAFNSGSVSELWWWSIPPGLLISLLVLSLFMFGRGYERVVHGEDADTLAKGN
jgi:peptide/nickel transport system permease protein